jgi:uncharacterized protein YeaO (DUF488 family)
VVAALAALSAASAPHLQQPHNRVAFPAGWRFPTRSTAVIKLKRAYEAASPDDGLRVLVDRLWPRGVSKERAALGLWLKEQFHERYRRELREKKDAVKLLRQKAKEGTVTLVYAFRDEEHNDAQVLKRFLQGR